MDHHGNMGLAVGTGVGEVEADRKDVIDLDGSELPLTSEDILDHEVDLGPVESRFAGLLGKGDSKGGGRIATGLFGEIPLGWIAGEVVKITPSDAALKIPHMGWNEIVVTQPHPLLAGIAPGANAYFVHSYQFKPALPDDLYATTDYGGALTAMIGYENIAGTQFHPEKSQDVGLQLLGNFLKWKP